MRITTLIENHTSESQPKLQAEHGVSFYIEHLDHVFLSDVGQSGKFAQNASRLGLDLTRVEALVISHYHYDHGGGLGKFFAENSTGKVYLRAAPGDYDYIGEAPGKPTRYIGLDKGVLKAHKDRIVTIDANREILPGLYLLVNIPNRYPRPSGDQRLKMQRGDLKVPDTFAHELVTVLEAEEGLVVLTGCAHNGVLNMIAATQQAFPKKPITAVIGGFHLGHEDEKAIQQVGEELLALDIHAVYSGHCTGEKAEAILSDVLGQKYRSLYTGWVMEF
jgi:7,8-dihydropterin-6-yl-methyl-4-(beta-D-ribofuranosyl)aminobenzene 5'-phosphate synthase